MPDDSNSLMEQLRRQRKTLISQKDWEGALSVIDRMLEIAVTTENWNQRGFILLQMHRYPEALENFDNALALTPDSQQALDGITKARAHMKKAEETTRTRYDEAAGTYQKPMAGNQPMAAIQEVTKRRQSPDYKNFGKYLLRQELGRGGMGIVYRAYDPQLRREVAIKTMLAQDDPMLLKRFGREAETMAKLSHPNIVKIYEVGELEGTPYFTMEFIDGQSLSHWLAEKKIPVKRAVEIMQKIALAIHYAHGKGIIHRDLKPSNIMVDGQGEPKVMDFGLAMDSSNKTQLSASGDTIGTPAYMSPEQALGKRKELDERSDVYSMGAVLYELLTGSPPFHGPSSQTVLYHVLEKDPVPPSQISPRIPKEMDSICLKAMAKDKALRYQSAEELADDLERFLHKQPILAAAPGLGYKLHKWLKKNWAVAGGGCMFLLGLACLLFIVPGSKAGQREHPAAHPAQVKKEPHPLPKTETRVKHEPGPNTEIQKVQAQLKDAELRIRETELRLKKTDEARQSLAEGKSHYRRKKTAEAIAAFQKAIELDPDLGDAYCNLANVYLDQQRITEAEPLLHKSLLTHKCVMARFNLGFVYHCQRKYTEALEEYKKALEIDATIGDVYCKMGELYLLMKNLPQATVILEKGLLYHKKCSTIHHNLGWAYYCQKKQAQAIEEYQKAIKLKPAWPNPHYELGLVYKEQNKYSEAVVHWKKYLQLAPKALNAKPLEEWIQKVEKQTSGQ